MVLTFRLAFLVISIAQIWCDIASCTVHSNLELIGYCFKVTNMPLCKSNSVDPRFDLFLLPELIYTSPRVTG